MGYHPPKAQVYRCNYFPLYVTLQ